MSQLALVLLLGLVGPLLALPRRFAIPVAVGELLIGVVFGQSALGLIKPNLPSLELISQIGFALVMMITASHIDLTRFFSKKDLFRAGRNVLISAAMALALSALIVNLLHLPALFGLVFVLLVSSSAAIFLPAVQQNEGFTAPGSVLLQVTLADLLAILLLPLVEDPSAFAREAIGVGVMTLAALVIFMALRWVNKNGLWKQMRDVSADRHFGLELRVSLILLLALIGLAQSLTVTIMLCGFGLGLAIAANGTPHRLAKQLFAVSEGFFAPVFFVLLGANIDVRAAFSDPGLIVLALSLGAGAVFTHLVLGFIGVPWTLAALSGAQLGVPAAAVSIGLASGLLSAGQAAAVMFGALITIVVAAIAAARITDSSITRAH